MRLGINLMRDIVWAWKLECSRAAKVVCLAWQLQWSDCDLVKVMTVPITGMESHKGYKSLLEGCQELGRSKRLAKEFVRYCVVKNFNRDASELPLSPSAQLDSLQHWVLLNTKCRRDVESLVGPIEHSTKTSFLSEKAKSLRRFASAAPNQSPCNMVQMLKNIVCSIA